MEENQKRWDEYFYNLCKAIAMNSQCLSRQLGAVLVRDKSIVSTGYNGPPREVPHCITTQPGICPRRVAGFERGNPIARELCPAAHAEVNCISNAARLGITTLGTTLYANCEVPCKNCLTQLINAGVCELVLINHEGFYDETSKLLVQVPTLKIRTFSNL